jgi:hypothetical protein
LNSSSIAKLTTHFYVRLDAHVGKIYIPTIQINFSPVPYNAYFWDIALIIKGINAYIYPLNVSTSHGMLSLIRLSFPLKLMSPNPLDHSHTPLQVHGISPLQVHGISSPVVIRPPATLQLILISAPHQAISGSQLPSPIPAPTTSIQVSSPISSPIKLSPSTSPTSTPSPSSHPDPPVSTHPMVTRAMNNIIKVRQLIDGTVRYPVPHALLVESTTKDLEPTCYTSAMKDPNWRRAMNVEFDSLLQNQTWTLVPPSSKSEYYWLQVGISVQEEG